MNITFIKLRGITKFLASCASSLSRIANCMERDLAARNIPIHSPKPDSSEPPEIFYTDEELDFVREMEEAARRMEGQLKERDPMEPEK